MVILAAHFPENLRGLGIGIFFSTVNIVAYGLGAPLIGRLNDRLGVTANPENMRLALLICPGSRARAAGAEGEEIDF